MYCASNFKVENFLILSGEEDNTEAGISAAPRNMVAGDKKLFN
jgi:hypothetical protein